MVTSRHFQHSTASHHSYSILPTLLIDEELPFVVNLGAEASPRHWTATAFPNNLKRRKVMNSRGHRVRVSVLTVVMVLSVVGWATAQQVDSSSDPKVVRGSGTRGTIPLWTG